MFHKITEITVLPGWRLLARFNGGQALAYDLAPLIASVPAFRSLKSVPGLMEQVRIDPGGHGISWNDELDLSAEEIFANGQQIPAATPEDLADIAQAHREYQQGETIPHDSIDWN